MNDYEAIYNERNQARQREEQAKETRPGYLRNATERQRHTAGLAAVVAAAKAEALEEARDKMMPPYNWNLDPHTGNERPGTSVVDEVYHDVYMEMTAMIEATRKATQ